MTWSSLDFSALCRRSLGRRPQGWGGFLERPLPEAVLRFPSPILWVPVTLSQCHRPLPVGHFPPPAARGKPLQSQGISEKRPYSHSLAEWTSFSFFIFPDQGLNLGALGCVNHRTSREFPRCLTGWKSWVLPGTLIPGSSCPLGAWWARGAGVGGGSGIGPLVFVLSPPSASLFLSVLFFLPFFFFFFFFFFFSIYLAALGLSCSARDLRSSLQSVGHLACGIFIP